MDLRSGGLRKTDQLKDQQQSTCVRPPMKAPVLATQLMGVRKNTVDYVFVDPPAKTEQQRKSERAQEGQELFLLLLPQIREPALRIGRLAAVAENGVPQGQRLPVVHEPTSSPPREAPSEAGER